ncbi:hypothetical protein EKN82_11435 [Enterobacter ludwigii]|nr:hypothetical protein EKN82_11435 [Enterobacter ludwigii]
MLHIVICIKHVCDLFDSEQSKKTRVQTTGTPAFVKMRGKILINYSTKTSAQQHVPSASRLTHPACPVQSGLEKGCRRNTPQYQRDNK